MKRPLALLCAGFAAGITVALFLPADKGGLAAGVLMIAASLIVAAGKQARFMAAVMVAFSVALLVGAQRTAAGDRISEQYAGKTVNVVFKVDDISELGSQYYSVTGTAVCGQDVFEFACRSNEYLPVGITVGSHITFGKYDRVRCRMDADDVSIYSYGYDGSFISRLRNGRMTLAGILKATVGGQEGAVAAGVIFGDKSDIAYELRNYFTNCGTSHILVVSGLHISVIAYLITAVMKRLKLPYFVRSIIIVSSCLLMLAALGFSVSVARVTLMTLLVYVGGNIRRKSDSLTLLLFSAAVIMAFDASAASDAGFWLSFGATFALVVVADAVNAGLRGFYSRVPSPVASIIKSLVCSAAAAVVLIPIETAFGLSISIISPLANLFVIALLPFVMVAGAAVVVLYLVLPGGWLLSVGVAGARLFTGIIIKVSEFFGDMRNVAFYSGDLPVRIVSSLVLAAAVLLVLLLLKKRRAMLSAAGILLALAVGVSYMAYRSQKISITNFKDRLTVLVQNGDDCLFFYGDSSYQIEKTNQLIRLEGANVKTAFALTEAKNRPGQTSSLKSGRVIFEQDIARAGESGMMLLDMGGGLTVFADGGSLSYAVYKTSGVRVLICFACNTIPDDLLDSDLIVAGDAIPDNIGAASGRVVTAGDDPGDIVIDDYGIKTFYFLKGGYMLWQ